MKKKLTFSLLAMGSIALMVGCSTKEEEFGYTGFVEGQTIEVQSDINAKVSDIHIEEGQTIKNDDVLITLNTEKLDLEIESAKAGVNIANAKKQEAEDSGVDTMIDQATGAVAQAENQLKLLELQKGNSTIKGPSDGVVQDIHISKGEIANLNETLITIMDDQTKEVTVYIDEKDLSSIKNEDKVTIQSDALEGKTFEGVIKNISNQAEFTPQNIQSKEGRAKRVFAVSIDVSDIEELKPGMSVSVQF